MGMPNVASSAGITAKESAARVPNVGCITTSNIIEQRSEGIPAR